jgi:ribosomal protein S18 acetylase RimI-like enzyme
MTTAIQTNRIAAHQIPDAGQVLSRAFFDDPLTNYWIPEEERRRSALPWFMTTAAKFGHNNGEVETTAAGVEGAALWLLPGKTHIPPLQMMLAGMWQAPFKLGMSNFGRFMKSLDYMEKIHKEQVPEDHWYLMILGVDPPRQGQGIGSALMQPALAKADAAHLPAYLETQKEINVRLYQKHGFEVVVETNLPGDGPHVWCMKRPAR